ncbi:hypothetical protein SAMN02745830_07262, partial [Streptomyces sp. Amel2xC10]
MKHSDLNSPGRCSFAAGPPCEGLGPLRVRAAVHLDEDDEDDGDDGDDGD